MFITENDAAEFLGLTVRTIRKWRGAKKGPPYSKIGRSVRYSREELKAWADSQKVTHDEA